MKALVHDAFELTVDLVEESHESVARNVLMVLREVPSLAEPAVAIDGLRRVSTRGVLEVVRGVHRGVRVVTDLGLDGAARVVEVSVEERSGREFGAEAGLLAWAAQADPTPVPMRCDAPGGAAWAADAALGLLNGAVGDHLRREGNALDLGMGLRFGDRYLEPEPAVLAEHVVEPSRRVAVFVHGLATTEWSWCLDAARYHGDESATFGTMLGRDLGFSSYYVRYNTGVRVSANGRALSRLIEALVAAHPGGLEELVLVGHSMGGLVVRSACHYANEVGHAWPAKLSRVFCLGSPHAGAPLANVGHLATHALGAVDTPTTLILARLLRGRSEGIKDLRHGSLVDEDWLGHDPDALRSPERREIPLLDGVAYHFLGATVSVDPEHPFGRLVGDILVRRESALAPATTSRERFDIEADVHGGMLHHQLQSHPAVYERLRRACAGEASPVDPGPTQRMT